MEKPILHSKLPYDQAHTLVHKNQCPFCGGKLFNGPQGMGSQNIFCGNVDDCDSRFNAYGDLVSYDGETPEEFKAFINKKDNRVNQ